MDDLKRAGLELMTLAKFIKQEMDKYCSEKCETTMTTPHAKLISYLFRHKNTDIFQKDLEEAFSVRSSTISRSLKQLEEDGFIIRTPVQQDSRLKKISLTEKSWKISDSFEESMIKLFRKMTEGLSKEEIESFLVTLNKMKVNLMND